MFNNFMHEVGFDSSSFSGHSECISIRKNVFFSIRTAFEDSGSKCKLKGDIGITVLI